MKTSDMIVPRSMRAVVYRGADDLRLETVPVPAIKAGELLVKVAVCGVCPTDIKKIHYGTVPPPRIFGHETAGVIAKVGAGVRGFRVGDRVALHHHVPCRTCHFCRHHDFAQCPQYKQTGITAGFEPAGGGYAEYVRVMRFVLPGVVRIPARNSFVEGAMLEPVNTVLKGVNRLGLLRGDTVMVVGQGPIGLMFTRLLQLRGMTVVATDLMESRVKLAREWGASAAFGGADTDLAAKLTRFLPQKNSKRLRQGQTLPLLHTLVEERGGVRRSNFREAPHLDPPYKPSIYRTPHPNLLPSGGEKEPPEAGTDLGVQGLDAVVLTVPSQEAFVEALAMVRGSGKVLLFAHTRRGEASAVDLSSVCVDEKDLLGSYSSDITLQEEVARLVFSRKLDTRRLVTHQYPLAETAAAVARASTPDAESLKIVVNQELIKGALPADNAKTKNLPADHAD